MKLFQKQIRLSLRAKITILIESLVIVIVIITGIITTMREKETMEVELTRRGLALASDLAQFSVRPVINNDLPTLRRFVNNTMGQDYVHYVVVLDPHGRVLMHSDLNEVNKIYKDSLSIAAVNSNEPGVTNVEFKPDEEKHNDIEIIMPIAIAGVRLATVRLGYCYMAIEKEITKARQQILLIGLLTTGSGGVIAFLLATFISSPIKRITDATEKVAHGNLNSQLEIKSNDEIGTLASAFNKMTEDLQKTTVSKDYFDNIIESMNDTLIVVSVDAKIKDVNKATCDLLEYSENELIGRDIHLIVPQEEEIFSNTGFQRLVAHSTPVNTEINYLAKSGKRIPMLFSAAVLKSKEGKREGVVCIARDITERKHIEEVLLRSEGELRFLSSKLLKAQEKERRRLSIELHDELGQDLMVLKLKMRAIQERMNDESVGLKSDCNEVIGYINQVAENVRRISRDLSPFILEDLGLTAAIRWLVEAFSKHSNIVSLLDITDIDNIFSYEGQIAIYRIIQECLTNIAKHSYATSTSISIKRMDEDVIVNIEDDGKGFHVREAFMRDPSLKGLGLATMHERIRMLGGSIYTMSNKGTGTKIVFSIPLSVGVKKH